MEKNPQMSEWIHMRQSFAKKLLKTTIKSFSCQPGLLGRANQPSGHEGLWEFSDCEIEKFCNRLKISVWLNSSINIGTVKAATTAPVVLYVSNTFYLSLASWLVPALSFRALDIIQSWSAWLVIESQKICVRAQLESLKLGSTCRIVT